MFCNRNRPCSPGLTTSDSSLGKHRRMPLGKFFHVDKYIIELFVIKTGDNACILVSMILKGGPEIVAVAGRA